MHEDLHRSGFERLFDCVACCVTIGQVERERAGVATGRSNLLDDLLRTFDACVRVHQYLAAIERKCARDRSADVTAAASDEGAS